MSKHHRDRSWAPAPQPLPENAHVIDNHTHVEGRGGFQLKERRYHGELDLVADLVALLANI